MRYSDFTPLRRLSSALLVVTVWLSSLAFAQVPAGDARAADLQANKTAEEIAADQRFAATKRLQDNQRLWSYGLIDYEAVYNAEVALVEAEIQLIKVQNKADSAAALSAAYDSAIRLAMQKINIEQERLKLGIGDRASLFRAEDQYNLFMALKHGSAEEIAKVKVAAAQRKLLPRQQAFAEGLIPHDEVAAVEAELAAAKLELENAQKSKAP